MPYHSYISREMTSQKIRQYLTLTCTEVTISHTIVNKNQQNMAVIQSRPTHIIYQCAKFCDDRMSFNVMWYIVHGPRGVTVHPPPQDPP